MNRGIVAAGLLSALVSIFTIGLRPAAAQDAGSVRGTVIDQLGGVVAGAQVALVRDGQSVKTATTDAGGAFTFDVIGEGRYQVSVTAAGFAPRTTDPIFVGGVGRVNLDDINLQVGGLESNVFVTASATDAPGSQIGASVTLLDSGMLDALGNTDLLEPIRTVPGVAIVQTGARGGSTSMFTRGGASNFNKVIIDGVPANDIGGSFDFADLATTGIQSVEVLRGSNSVQYGSDAMTGVVNITTKRGRSRVPEAALSIDGGNFATSHADVSLGGAVRRFDYFADYSHLKTDNDVENNAYRNDTLAGRFGMTLGSNTDLSGTIRWIDTDSGSPGSTNFYGIADDSNLAKTTTYASVAAQTQITDKWQSTIRFGIANQDYHFVNRSPTGTPSDDSAFANYLGDVVTITGANGYSVTGQAILDFGGDYPSLYDAKVTRRLFYGQTDYRISPSFVVAGGARLENENGKSVSSFSTDKTDRTNYGGFVEARAALLGHLYVTAGMGVDHNEVFGTEPAPRVSVAAYLRQPSSTEALGDTKVTFNAGKGIKEPSLSQELSSLFKLLPSDTAGNLGVSAIGPERSRTLDVGIEQGFARGHARVRATYFNSDFKDLIEFVSKSVLPQVGVPVEAAEASGFGAYVNAQSNTSKGVELSGEASGGGFRFTASYTYLDAVVTKSLGSGALFPAENPQFPGILIGQYTPLVGERPFRRPKNSGSMTLTYVRAKAQVALAGYFFGKQDDSTFLSDPFFGYSMLLPNKDMDAAYQKFDVSGSYRFHPRVRGYMTLENALDEKYEAAAGFPALPRAVRAGVTISLGGDRP